MPKMVKVAGQEFDLEKDPAGALKALDAHHAKQIEDLKAELKGNGQPKVDFSKMSDEELAAQGLFRKPKDKPEDDPKNKPMTMADYEAMRKREDAAAQTNAWAQARWSEVVKEYPFVDSSQAGYDKKLYEKLTRHMQEHVIPNPVVAARHLFGQHTAAAAYRASAGMEAVDAASGGGGGGAGVCWRRKREFGQGG